MDCFHPLRFYIFKRSGDKQWGSLAPVAAFYTNNLERLWDGAQRDRGVDPGGEQASGGPHRMHQRFVRVIVSLQSLLELFLPRGLALIFITQLRHGQGKNI